MPTDLVEILEERGLHLEVLGDRLDDEVDAGQVVERRAAGEVAEDAVLLRLGQLAALDRLVQGALDRGAHGVDLVGGAADVQHVVATLGEHLDDAAGHRAGADDADRADVVAQLRLVGLLGGPEVRDHLIAVGTGVGVEAVARLPAQQPRRHHLLEDRRRRVQPVAALLVHRVEDLVRRVEADQVEQRQRTHGVAAAEPHGRVDVLARGVLGLEHRHGVVEVAEEQRVGDEPCLVAADDGVLAEPSDERLHVGEHARLGHDRADDLDEVLHRGRVEEVDADHAARARVGGADLGDRQRRGVGRQDRVGPDHLVEAPEEVLLDLEGLDDRLDDQVGVRQRLEIGAEGDVVEDRLLLGLGDLAAGHRTAGGVLEVLATALDAGLVLLDPITEKPLRANTSAMPAPMVPRPITPIVSKVRPAAGSALGGARWRCSSWRASCHAVRASPLVA